MLATLAHATSSTRPTIPSSAAAIGARLPSIIGWRRTSVAGNTWAARFRFVSGYSTSRRAMTVSTRARACSKLTPGFRRALTNSHRVARRWRRVSPGEGSTSSMPAGCTPSDIARGIHSSGAKPGIVPVNDSGATPTMV